VLSLHAHADRLVRDAAPLVGRALELIVGVGGELSEVDLDMVSAVIGRPDLRASPQAIGVAERSVAALREIHRAARDPRVPRALIEALRAAWFQPPHVGAQVWLELAGRLASVDLDALCVVLERDHPAVLGVMCQVEMRFQSASAPPAASPDLSALQARFPPSFRAPVRLFEQAWFQTLSFAAVFLVSVVILALLVRSPVLVTGGALAAGAVVAPLLWRRMRARNTAQWGTPSELVAAARDHTLWPRELALALAPAEPVPILTRYAYVVDHPLVVWEQDSAATLRVITPSHVARVPRA
jgi:hypothetical protein